MSNLGKICFLAVVAVALAACGGIGLEQARSVTPKGSPFDVQLYKDYVKLSATEYGEGDYRNSDIFASRAMAAASGQPTQPEIVSTRRVPPGTVNELAAARDRLVAALDKGAAEKAAKPTAHAQAMYECWMEELEENTQPNEIAACRNGFTEAMAEVDAALKPVAAAPAPQPVAMPGPFIIYFDFSSAKLTPVAKSVVSTVVTAVSKVKPETVIVTGNTDRAGSDAYNMALSKKRAAAVAAALKAAGMTTNIKLIVASYGEKDLAVPTADGVREAKNRRVTIVLK